MPDAGASTRPAYPAVEWCGACFVQPIMDEQGRVCAESRRMCGEKEPHEWHVDRYDKSFRWRADPPLAERQPTTTGDSAP